FAWSIVGAWFGDRETNTSAEVIATTTTPIAASFRHGLSTEGGRMDGMLGGEPSVFGSDSNRIPPRERMAKRPNGGSCLIRFETKVKLGRGRGRESLLWNSYPGPMKRRKSSNEPRRPADIVLQSFNTVSSDAQTGAGVTERLM